MKKNLGIMMATVICASTAFAAASTTSAGGMPNGVSIEKVAWAGSGCGAGSSDADIDVNSNELVLITPSLRGDMGRGYSPADARSNCQVLLDIVVPYGWSYAITRVDMAGRADLDYGTSASAGLSYYFQGAADDVPVKTTLTGPTDRDFVIRAQLPMSDLAWSPCYKDRALNINMSASVHGDQGREAHIALGYRYQDNRVRLGFKWKRCY